MKHILAKASVLFAFILMVSFTGFGPAYGYGVTTSTKVGIRTQNIAAYRAINTNGTIPYKLASAGTTYQRSQTASGLAPVAKDIEGAYLTLETSALTTEEKQGFYVELSKVMRHFMSLFTF